MFAAQNVMTVEVKGTERQEQGWYKEQAGGVLAHLCISSESPLLSHSKSTQNKNIVPALQMSL